MDITQVSIIHHIAVVLLLLWGVSSIGFSHPVVFFVSLVYLYKVNELYTLRLRKKLQFEERKSANQRRLLSDSESVRWLNHAVEKIWPVCMEQIASQQFLLPVIPWFLEKYKPWTAKEAVVQHLYLGRRPPMFTEIRVLGESADDDHLVLELGMNFLSGEDMSMILAVQPRLGLGMWANMHVTGMHVEGKILVGIKFLRSWPFLGRLRVSFVEPPYFQMTVKPIFNHGVDVTELPGIAGWLDNMLALAFEQTLVEPNMLVVDVEKFASSPAADWFTIDEKTPVAHARIEILEAADLKPSDMNGLADPYVKGHCGPYRFRSKIQKKTLSPKWLEEFKIPVTSWEAPNVLVLELRDKDHIFDDMLGDCAININDLRGGQRHDKWLPLRNIKIGRLHLAITILEGEDDKGMDHESEHNNKRQNDDESLSKTSESSGSNSMAQNQDTEKASREGSHHMVDNFEPINIEGQEKTGIWVHHPGMDVSQSWEPRKGRARRPETLLQCEKNEVSDSPRSTTESDDNGRKIHRLNTFKRSMHKIGSLFHSNSKDKNSIGDTDEFVAHTPRPNLRSTGEKRTAVRIIYEDSSDLNKAGGGTSPEKDEDGSSKRGRMKDIAKNIVKKPAHALKSVLSKKGSFGASEERSSALDSSDASVEEIPIDSGSNTPRKMESIKEGGDLQSSLVEKDAKISATVEENDKGREVGR